MRHPHRVRRAVPALALTVGLLGGCGKDPAGAPTSTSGAAASAALLAHVPADSPYVLTSFAPIPDASWAALTRMYEPVLRLAEKQAQQDPVQAMVWSALERGNVLTFDRAKLEQIGFSREGSYVLYGLGAYPVYRLQLASGDRLVETATRVATVLGKPLPAPTIESDRRTWMFPLGDDGLTLFAAVAPRELVVALLPAEELARQKALVLGTEKPKAPIDRRQLDEVRRRGGYGPYAFGFADLPRVLALAAESQAGTADAPSPGCRRVLDELAARMPRFTMGLGDLAGGGFSFGYRLELAPELARDVQALATDVAMVEPPAGRAPLFLAAGGIDLARGRALAARAGAALEEVGAACGSGAAQAGRALTELAATPVPPATASLRGGSLVGYGLELGADGTPARVDAQAVLTFGDTAAAFAELAADPETPGLLADGKAHPVPDLPFAAGNHIAITPTAIAIGLGAGSDQAVVAAATVKPTRAPLLRFGLEMKPFAGLALRDSADLTPDESALAEHIFAALGWVSGELVVDEHGIAIWTRLGVPPPGKTTWL